MSTMKTNALLTTGQVARRCNVKGRTVARWLREGELKGIKLNRHTWRVREADLENFLEGKATPPE